jgi:hypothetical protein
MYTHKLAEVCRKTGQLRRRKGTNYLKFSSCQQCNELNSSIQNPRKSYFPVFSRMRYLVDGMCGRFPWHHQRLPFAPFLGFTRSVLTSQNKFTRTNAPSQEMQKCSCGSSILFFTSVTQTYEQCVC